MGHDQHEKSGSSGVVVALLLAVLLIVIVGAVVLVGVGSIFWLRTARVAAERATVAERMARVEAERARALAEARMVEAEAERPDAQMPAEGPLSRDAAGDSNASRSNIRLRIDSDGKLSVGGEQLDLEQLKTQLQRLRQDSGEPLSVEIFVHPDSLLVHVVPVLEACQDVVETVTLRIGVVGSD